MSKSYSNRRSITELDQQLSRLSKELWHLIDVGLNCMFALNIKGTRRRSKMLIGAFLILLFLFGLFSQEISIWLGYLRNIFLYLFNPTVAVSFVTNPIQDFFQFIRGTYLNWVGFRYLLVFTLPFLVALQLAATYLADIFESKVEIARTFIWQVALRGGNNKIRIYEGEMDRESEISPVSEIGGPGLVIVELDSAALFERPDGRPHVIGPTVNGPVVLDGFERFRQAIDLRDHRTEILDIASRSSDGIPVQAVNVNFLFSVLRNNNQPSSENPYSFSNNNVIESLIYGQAARVTPDGPRPADISKDWAGTMKGLIRKTLGEFMSEHNLTQYLASFGMPEIQSAREQANAVVQVARRVLPPEGPLPTLAIDETPPPFIPRPEIKSSLFGNFAQAFPVLAAQRGVELHWVGIGSWKTPNEIIPEQHLDAWQLSMDNHAQQNIGRPDLHPRHIIRFIQDIPLARFVENLKRERSHHEIMFSLLVGYREQFIKILNIMEKKWDGLDSIIINRILEALQHLNRILGLPDGAHWINQRPAPHGSPSGGRPPSQTPAPQPESQAQSIPSYSSEELRLFSVLMQKTRNVRVAERLIDHERILTPTASEMDLIRRAIEHWERDNH